MKNTKTTQTLKTKPRRVWPHTNRKQCYHNHTPISKRVWKVRQNSTHECRVSRQWCPTWREGELELALRDGFVCSVWNCNYRVSALVLMVYYKMVGRFGSLKTKRTGHWWKLKTSLHGSWEEERVECENCSRWRERTVLCYYFIGQSFVNSTVQAMHFVFMLTKKVEYLHAQMF